jgi:hypothetical protein
MVIQELKAEFNEYFQSPDAELVLWLDPESQWRGVIEHLKDAFQIIEFNGSQLEVKAKVELSWDKGERQKFILYLCGLSRDDLTVLKEYEFSSKVFEDSILKAFSRWGLEFEREHEPQLLEMLPILVARFATKSITFWKDRLTPEKLRELLFNHDDVRKMLAQPEITIRELKEKETYQVFCDYVKDKFAGPDPRDYNKPQEWAERFTGYLILTEVKAAIGKNTTFPQFDIAPADERHEKECISFLKDWMKNATYKDEFKMLSELVEKKYDLSSWAASQKTYVDIESSLNIERIFEKQMLLRINATRTIKEFGNLLVTESDHISRMSSHFWSNEGEIVVWNALALAQKIINAVERASSVIEKANSASEMVQEYASNWWKIDNDYRTFRLKTDSDDKLNTLSRHVKIKYRDYQNQLNEKFLSLISKQKDLSIEGFSKQSEFWENVSSSKKRRAVILVDALRYELGQDLIANFLKLMRDTEISCEPLIASLPTLTPIGMSFLIPAGDIKIDVIDGNWQVQSSDCTGNLSLVSERKKIIKKRHPRATIFDDLEALISASEVELKQGNPIVVFTRELDCLGHDSGLLNLSLNYLGEYISGLSKTIKRLVIAGIEEIHIVSDHGFLIIEDILEADKIPLDKQSSILYAGHRCIVGKNLPEDLGVIFDLPDSEGLKFCTPQGTGMFKKSGKNEFIHGGVSLQEMVVPHIKITLKKIQPKYGAKIKAPEAVHNLIFEIEILRAIPGEGLMFGSPRYLEIRGFLGNDEIIRQTEPDYVINEANEHLIIRIRIKPGTKFKYGDVLRLELRDADTGELLDSVEVRIEVESNE